MPTENPALSALLDSVEAAANGWEWHPDTDFGATEALVPSRLMIDLDEKLAAYYESLEGVVGP